MALLKQTEFGYFVDNEGNVYNKEKKPMKLQNHTQGYKKVCFFDTENKKRCNRYVHRLVAELFLDNPEKHKYVNHKDGNKHNNHVSNLEWCTARHNTLHAIEKGLIKSGELSTSSKLTKKQVEEIRQTYVKGKITYLELSKKYGVCKQQIERIVNFKRWKDA